VLKRMCGVQEAIEVEGFSVGLLGHNHMLRTLKDMDTKADVPRQTIYASPLNFKPQINKRLQGLMLFAT
jgi:hypothetical protein